MSKTGWIERHGITEKLSNVFIQYSSSSVYPPVFLCISLLCTKSLHTQVFHEYLPHHMCVDCLSHVDKSLWICDLACGLYCRLILF